jgi:hypothetical protein
MTRHRAWTAATWGASLAAACIPRPASGPDDLPRGLRAGDTATADDPTVRGARLFPERLEEGHGWGTEPEGGIRSIVAGVRVVSRDDGSMAVAEDRFPATPASVASLPERLGGGFLFSIGANVWRAETWLGRSRVLFAWSAPVSHILVGLDRVYFRSPQGAMIAVDATTGSSLGLGPLPASPHIGRLEALDAWRAVAIADLRGALITVDAGSTWRPVPLPIDPIELVPLDDSIAIGGLDKSRQLQWWDVRADGQPSKLAVAPPPRHSARDEHAAPTADPLASAPNFGSSPTADAARRLGPRPLATAIEDGWPLSDGTALVARDGVLARVRLADGAVVEVVPNAFPLRPARCHAIALGFDRAASRATHSNATTTPEGADRDPSDGAVGFACGEPRGRTVLYRWDPSDGRLVELRRFNVPRQVLGFGNGALAVRGACAADAPEDTFSATGAAHDADVWCVAPPHRTWRELRVESFARIVVLSDGRTGWVRPPTAGNLTTATWVLEGEGRPIETPIAFPPLPADVVHALALGVWLDGLEERRPGVVGGWIDAAGSLVGVEIAATGVARIGEYIRDAGAPVAAGRWAFGFTASRRGFETSDGGMTWTKELPMPDVIASGRAVRERACGPVGCIGGGWLRVGWGPSEQPLAPDPPARVAPASPEGPDLELDCVAQGGQAPTTAAPTTSPAALPPSRPRPTRRRDPTASLYSGSTWGAVSDLPAFGAWPGPSMAAGDIGVSLETSGGIEARLRVPLARLYAWGPESGEWNLHGRWQARWQWPWGGWQDVRASSIAPSPWSSLDAARRALGMGPGLPITWSVVDTDDPDHALFLARHNLGTASTEVVVAEADHPAVEVRRPNGEPFADVEAAARVGGRWYVATAQSPGEGAATVLFSIEAGIAREVLRVPRVGFETRPPVRIARNTDGHGLALVVDGQLDGDRGAATRWIASVDPTGGSIGTPEPLAPVSLSDRTVSPCTGDDPGWLLDLPYPGHVRIHVGARWETNVSAPMARMRISHDHACVERVLGTVDAYGSPAPEPLLDPSLGLDREVDHERAGSREIPVSVYSARVRRPLRCALR